MHARARISGLPPQDLANQLPEGRSVLLRPVDCHRHEVWVDRRDDEQPSALTNAVNAVRPDSAQADFATQSAELRLQSRTEMPDHPMNYETCDLFRFGPVSRPRGRSTKRFRHDLRGRAAGYNEIVAPREL